MPPLSVLDERMAPWRLWCTFIAEGTSCTAEVANSVKLGSFENLRVEITAQEQALLSAG